MVREMRQYVKWGLTPLATAIECASLTNSRSIGPARVAHLVEFELAKVWFSYENRYAEQELRLIRNPKDDNPG